MCMFQHVKGPDDSGDQQDDLSLLILHMLKTLLLLNMICPVLANSVDPDQLASEEALFVIKYVNFYQKPRSSNLIGWKLEVGMVS